MIISDKGNVYEEVSLELTGEYLDIAFNSRYFLEGLKNIDSEEIFIEFTTNINPCIIRPADDVKSLIDNFIKLFFSDCDNSDALSILFKSSFVFNFTFELYSLGNNFL